METGPLKSFATWARTELIKEVSARVSAVLAPGSSERIEDAAAVKALENAIKAGGGDAAGREKVADKVAYSWFNRIVALRFMDANGYTGIGVVSAHHGQVSGQPEVLADAKRGVIDSEVVGKHSAEVISALLDGTRRSIDPQGEAYSLLLAEYCQHWHRSMPFMFEREGDYTELLIPANLLADDSVLARAVAVLTEVVCRDVEVIGWLYQFYISERKDEVFAGFKKNKKAGADEIPAATQLFTPHWIVRYLVENSLGRLWMLNHPASRLVDQMDYYIAPVDEEIDFLKIASPEELTVIDPACGSGHMLTYAFDLLYAIYEEQGYARSEIPGLILTHNLYGTEIDPRAGALAAFALTMKARARQRSFFNKQVEPSVCVIEPITFAPDELAYLVTKDGDRHAEEAFWNQFTEADTLGALIQPGVALVDRLGRHLASLTDGGDLLLADTIDWAERVITQAQYLSTMYAVVVLNPPYMGSGNLSPALSATVREAFPAGKQDLYGCFILRSVDLAHPSGLTAMVIGDTWLTIKSFEALRRRLLDRHSLCSLVHMHDVSNHPDVFGANTAFVVGPRSGPAETTPFFYLDQASETAKREALRQAIEEDGAEQRYATHPLQFLEIPGAPFAFRLPEPMVRLLTEPVPMSRSLPAVAGISTGSNDRFFRYWHEVSQSRTGGGAVDRPWAPHHKGGPERRWYGNVSHVLRYNSSAIAEMERLPGFRHDGNASYFYPHVGWSALTSGRPSFRMIEAGHTFGSGSKAIVGERSELLKALAVLNSSLASELLAALSPTMNFEVGHIGRLPTLAGDTATVENLVERAIELSREEWDEDELSLGFNRSPLVCGAPSLLAALETQREQVTERASALVEIERAIDLGVRRALNVNTNPPDRRPLGKPPTPQDMVTDFVSYAVGCMFGRYSLDEPGMILADQGGTLQDYVAKIPTPTFMPDADNVIPIVDGDWFEDDIVERFRQFLRIAFGDQHFEENLRFVTKSLGVKNLRDYFVKSFYKDHVQRYKKRPIYWLFSSPKGSFNALIYMHRYTPSTVSTVLNEYLREFHAKLQASLTQAERANDAREADRLRKVLVELNEYEHDVLYPLATQRVAIDLDDGVKANYPKFGAALKRIPGLEAAG